MYELALGQLWSFIVRLECLVCQALDDDNSMLLDVFVFPRDSAISEGFGRMQHYGIVLK
jgi:hypothetical protein